jgi:hypothetical protein
MADFRTVQTRMWREDEWFQNLGESARLLWVYLFTNPSANSAGLYRLPIGTIAFESGVSGGIKRVASLISEFSEADKAHYESGVVYVVKMQALQHPEISWQVATRIAADVDAIPDGRLKQMYLLRYGYPIIKESMGDKGKIIREIEYQYPIDAPSMPNRFTVTYSNSDTDTDTDTKGAQVPPLATASPSAPPEPKPKAAAKKPPKEPKQAEPLPMPVQVFVDSGGSFPSGKLQDGTPKRERAIRFITEHVTDDKASLDLWAKVVTGYCAQWSSSSYTVMVNDYYLSGRIPGAPNNNGGGYAASRNGRSSNGQGFGLRRQPGDKGAPEPTETERAEFLAAQAALAKQAAINAQATGRTYLS